MSPYNIAKALGGDTPAVDDRMDRCVKDVMATGKSKIHAVAICKSSIQKSLAKKQKK